MSASASACASTTDTSRWDSRSIVRFANFSCGFSMSEAALFRPGIVAGDYPEREDERVSLLDRLGDAAVGFVRQRLPVNRSSRQFIARVGAAAAGLDRASEEELAAAIRALRVELPRHGLRPDLVARSFALIREVAGRRLGMRHFDVQLA